jgi:heme exporter protein A
MIAHLPIKLLAEDVTVMRGNRRVISGLTLSVARGEALILTGRNGIGKTTLLRALAGFLPLASGKLRLEGWPEDAAIGEACHFVGHLNGVKPALTAIETLQFFAGFLGGPDGAAERAAERLGLSSLADIPAGYLSAGQKRRLGLARLLCAERPVWLMDEPAVSLDTASQKLLARIVNEHLAGGGIVVAATHTGLGWDGMRTLDLGDAAQSLRAAVS